MFSKSFQKNTLQTIWKDSDSSLWKDFKVGAFTWILGCPATMFIGQVLDLLICKIFGAISYEQVAVYQLKLALQSPLLLFSTLFSILIAAPILEEFLFRGILQNYFKQFIGRKTAIALSAFFFALIHLSSFQGLGNIPLIFSLFTFGCFLGFVYERQRSLLSSIALHMTFNGISTLQILFISWWCLCFSWKISIIF